MLQNLLLISCWVCNMLQIKEHSKKLAHHLFQNDADSRKIVGLPANLGNVAGMYSICT